jgi:hypothetical protein
MTAHHLAAQGIESVDDWNAKLAQRKADKEETNRIVLSPDTPGEEKMVRDAPSSIARLACERGTHEVIPHSCRAQI